MRRRPQHRLRLRVLVIKGETDEDLDPTLAAESWRRAQALAEKLGDERSAELFARGAALSSAAATELVRAAAANVLEENEGRPDNGA